jgi:hypothetical protein
MLAAVHRFPDQEAGCWTASIKGGVSMNTDWIIAAFLIIGTVLERLK